ncbi:MAG: cell envelope integrity protein CreD [Candidatus Cloacimonetes bacterium]|nr:cell envelope integrity protein CreD [Candidatus Cloacimonadota bacterium]
MQEKKPKNKLGLKLLIIGALILVLLIPGAMIMSLIRERQIRRDDAVFEVSEKWGQEQTVSGPVISIPFKTFFKDKKGNWTVYTHYAHFLPDDLSIEAMVNPEIRYRGIYEVVLYNTSLKLKGNFSSINMKKFSIPAKDILWQESFLSVGITHMKGIKESIIVNWNDSELTVNPGIESNDILASGFSTRINVKPDNENMEFSLEIDLNGSGGLHFAPLGNETNVNIVSNWKNPSFIGEFLPENREVTDEGFSANWKVLQLNRNYPQEWIGNKFRIESSTFGVELLLPVDEYQKNMRTVKYAIMFILLTFLAFFMMETLNKKKIHPFQYLLVGTALIIFYTLLLSISEHLSFKYAYLIASVATIALITAYTKSVLKDKKLTSIIALILIILYCFLYVLLQLQDYALLLGSIGLFVILAVVMYISRKIDWYAGSA